MEDWVLKSEDQVRIYKFMPHSKLSESQKHIDEVKNQDSLRSERKEWIKVGWAAKQGFESWKPHEVREKMKGAGGEGCEGWEV